MKKILQRGFIVGLFLLFQAIMAQDSFEQELKVENKENKDKESLACHYDFSKARNDFSKKSDLSNLSQYSCEEVQEKILSTVPKVLRPRVAKLLPDILSLSQRYEVDPFLVLSIIRQESHFRVAIKSRDGGHGAMQLMPKTAHFVRKKVVTSEMASLPESSAKTPIKRSDLLKPEVNLELGIGYLSHLIKTYSSAEIGALAYNRGTRWAEYYKRQMKRKHHKKLERYPYLAGLKVHYKNFKTPFSS